MKGKRQKRLGVLGLLKSCPGGTTRRWHPSPPPPAAFVDQLLSRILLSWESIWVWLSLFYHQSFFQCLSADILLSVSFYLITMVIHHLPQMLEMKERPVRLRQFDDQLQLMVPRTRRLGTGAAFSVNGPKLWNALPLNLRNVLSLNSFKKNLKTYLFK